MARFVVEGLRWSGWFLAALLALTPLARSSDPLPPSVSPPSLRPDPVPGGPVVEKSDGKPLESAVDRPPANERAAEPSPQETMLEEIVRLRRALGSPLQSNPSGDRAFAEALRELVRPPMAAPHLPPVGSLVPESRVLVEETAPLPLGDPPSRFDEVVIPTPTLLPQSPLANVLNVLRSTSRQLDMCAHDLDDQRSHKDADRVRRIAKRLRRDVRQLELDAEASAP